MSLSIIRYMQTCIIFYILSPFMRLFTPLRPFLCDRTQPVSRSVSHVSFPAAEQRTFSSDLPHQKKGLRCFCEVLIDRFVCLWVCSRITDFASSGYFGVPGDKQAYSHSFLSSQTGCAPPFSSKLITFASFMSWHLLSSRWLHSDQISS